MKDQEKPNRAADMVAGFARQLLDAQCFTVQKYGVGNSMFLGQETGMADKMGRKIRAVLHLSFGAYSDEEIRALKAHCMAAAQDARTPHERTETITDKDTLPPAADSEGGPS